MYKNIKTILVVAAISLSIISCSKKEEELKEPVVIEKIKTVIKEVPVAANSKFILELDSKFGSEDFELNKEFTSDSKTYKFKQLRYWISNVSFVKEDGTKINIPNSYYLMGENGDITIESTSGKSVYPARKREDVQLNELPLGKYTGIEFSVGVDSKYNDNLSLQAGELNQSNGMNGVAWMWSTSYIFTKLEGTVTSAGVAKDFATDTGGNDNYKIVNISGDFEIKEDSENTFGVNLDIEKLFNGLDLFTNTPEMTTLTNNYKNAFSKK